MDRPDVGAPEAAINEADITRQIINMLAEMVRRDPESITPQTHLFDDLAFDSTSVLELLMQLEDTLGIEVDPFTVEPSDFEVVASLVTYVVGQTEA